jgi:hypothetical protein
MICVPYVYVCMCMHVRMGMSVYIIYIRGMYVCMYVYLGYYYVLTTLVQTYPEYLNAGTIDRRGVLPEQHRRRTAHQPAVLFQRQVV